MTARSDRHRYGECACCGRWGRLTGRGLLRGCEARERVGGGLGEWPTRRELVRADIALALAAGEPVVRVAARAGVDRVTVWRVRGANKVA